MQSSSHAGTASFLASLANHLGQSNVGRDAYLTLPSEGCLAALVKDFGAALSSSPGDGLHIVAGAALLRRALEGSDGWLPQVSRLYLAGEAPGGLSRMANVRRIDPPCRGSEAVFAALSSTWSLAFVNVPSGWPGPDSFIEGPQWVVKRPIVEHIVQGAAAEVGEPPELPEPANPAAGECSDFLSHVVQVSLGNAGLPPTALNVRRDELFSVLEILKAISAERRSHDILYVFVESIARVVECSRCSVVRVWGHQRTGQVLASHEDERVTNITIDLDRYPEIVRTLRTGERTVVADSQKDDLTKPFAEELKKAGRTTSSKLLMK